MADTAFGTNHPLAVKVWTRKMIHEALRQTWFSKFIGEGSNSVIQKYTELQKGPGDTVYPMLRMQLTGNGVQGDGTLEGQEEELQTARDSVVLNQLRHAVRSIGRASEQNVPFSMREEAYLGLSDWWANRLDECFFNQLGGNSNQSDTRFTGNNTVNAPSTNNHLFVGGTAEASLTASASSAFSLTVVDRMVVRAKTKASTPIRPIRIGGEEKYVAFIHPFQHHQLRTTAAASGNYLDIQKAAIQGGQVTGSPLYTGAIGEWHGVILHESTRVPGHNSGNTNIGVANVYRAILAGAQAANLVMGNDTSEQYPNWFEELFDYGNKLGVAGGMIFGINKSRFTISGAAEDFGVVIASTFSPDPS